MKTASALVLVLILGVTVPRAAAPTIAIDASMLAGKVSPLLYGLMAEEINHSYDGGLYAELIRNRAFLDDTVESSRARGPQPRHRPGASLRPAGTAVTLAGDPQDTNSIDAPERVVPKTSPVTGVNSGFTYTVPANGIVVLELGTR